MTTSIRSITINPTETITTQNLPADSIGTSICATIGCSMFDVVALQDEIDLFVDDEGLINGSPLNLPATVLTHLLGSPTVIFTRDVVMRATALDTAYRQRTIETVALQPNGLEFRFIPLQPMPGPLGARLPPDIGFGCGDNPNVLRIERRGPDEIVFPGCNEVPSALRRCSKV